MSKPVWIVVTACMSVATVSGAVPPTAETPPSAQMATSPELPQACLATDAYTPICGLQSPEDMDTLDASHLLVVQMRNMANTGDSNFAVVDVETRAVTVLRIAAATPKPTWGDPTCTAPDPRPAFHGFDRWTDAGGVRRVLVVNHGTRSSVERFRLHRDAQGDLLEWEGCVLVPKEIQLNDVASLPGGAFAASVMGETKYFGNPEGMEFLLSGKETGDLVEWWPAGGWQSLPDSRAAFPNGVVASRDARYLYFAAWTGREVLKYDREDKSIVARTKVDFLPDNLSWTPGGTLLTAGVPDPEGVRRCVSAKALLCPDAFSVAEIDPKTMSARTLLSAPTGVLGGASVAVRVGEELYVGAFSGDRIVRIRTNVE